MKTNFFGEPVLQPGDDIGAAFGDAYGTDLGARLTARFIENDDNFGWTCNIESDDGDEMQAHDFKSEAALLEWLAAARIEIEV